MNKTYSMGLMLVSTVAMLSSCASDNVISESLPVATHEVSISCFQKEMTDLGVLETRADNPASLKDTKTFTELEVALIPVDAAEEDSGYVVRQDSAMSDFGKVKLEVPEGTYHMVVVAANTKDFSAGRVTIHSSTKVTFPNDTPSDMVYAYKQITVEANKSNQAYDAALTRGVSAFKLQAIDFAPLNIASEKVTITGNCGRAFNPVTGRCVTTDGVSRNPSFDPSKYTNKKVNVQLYTFLVDDDVSNLTVDAEAIDKDGKVVRSLHFDDVHLVKGKLTIYKGSVFTTNNTADFTVETPTMEESSYSKEF